MKITFFGIPILFVLAIILSANHAYAPCIEGPGINCNGYPTHALTQINSDKLNYEISDKPVIIIVGVPYTVVHLEIDDSSSNIVFTHEINLSSTGTARYILDISSYNPGVYSAIANSLTSKLTTGFAVGLAPVGGHIVLNPDRTSYLPGDNATILGTWNPNTLIQLSLIDPSGISVKSIQTFSDKTGHFSSSDITIPLNAISGIWQISATSGVSHTQVQITINSTNNFARNITNSTSMPPNAIRTQNGGWITPLQTTDQNGNNLTIHYEGQGIDVTGKVLPSPAVPNLITHNMFSPLPQFKSGVNTNDIICKEGLYLAIKSHDKEPTCLKAGTISKLASRGFLYGINDNQTNYTTILIPPGSENSSSNKTYSPDVTTVVLGVNNTITWVNQAETTNSIVSDMPLQQDRKSFDSNGVIKPGGSYQFTFTEPGTIGYHGEPHPWQKGTIIVLPYESSNFTPFAAKTYNLKQVHYYDSSNFHPKVSLYDYSYDGIDKDGLVSIDNQNFYQTTLDNDIYKLKGIFAQFHNVTFSFPEGTLTTPGGAFVNLDVKFQDGSEEIYGGTTSNPDGSGMTGGIPTPTQYGPHVSTNSITVLGNHTMPQAGLTIYHDKIKLLVSADDKMSTENNTSVNKILGIIPSCASTIPHQYAIAGPPGDPMCPYANFVASDKILNATGFYGIYNYTSYPGTLNYVLEPGHNGTIMFLIHMNMIHHNASTIPYFNQINITNDIVFMHDAGMHNHPGVDVLVEPKSQMIRDDGSSVVTMTFSASKDALPGVYWVTLPPGFCVGGQMIILTVTDCEK